MEWNDINVSSLHLGLTYKCTLACLECARTHATKKHIPDIVNTMHLDWKQYKSLIDEVNPRLIELCGNWGDPIYYPSLIPLIKYIKKRNKHTYIVLHTNGSYRPASFWKPLADPRECVSPREFLRAMTPGMKEIPTARSLAATDTCFSTGLDSKKGLGDP